MIPLTLTAVPASVVMRGDPAALATGVTIDSRAVRPGDLFIAIRGGIDFIESAVEQGAIAVIVEEEEAPAKPAPVPIASESEEDGSVEDCEL